MYITYAHAPRASPCGATHLPRAAVSVQGSSQGQLQTMRAALGQEWCSGGLMAAFERHVLHLQNMPR